MPPTKPRNRVGFLRGGLPADCNLTLAPSTVRASEGDSGPPVTGRRFRLVAYTGVRMRPLYWGDDVVVDLDGLKHVNDTQGHAAGDELLRRAGVVLESITRPSDLRVRRGGDEFVCLVATADPGSDWPGIQHRFRLALDGRHGVTASVGAAPAGHFDVADWRMYVQKMGRKQRNAN